VAGLFITGTDTGVGKTRVTCRLAHGLRRHGFRVLLMKPVATGCIRISGQLRNEDALLLRQAASQHLPYEQINPYAFEPAASPHIAARLAGREISLEHIVERVRSLEALADIVLVEGVGGYEVPLNGRQRVSDLATALGLPVVLVVAMKLGCLNHALLSHGAIRRSGAPLAGWIANQPFGNFPFLEENIATLKSDLDSPCLGLIPHENQELDEFCGASKKAEVGGLNEDEILRIFNG
jgi:dethiobiotin synthetase